MTAADRPEGVPHQGESVLPRVLPLSAIREAHERALVSNRRAAALCRSGNASARDIVNPETVAPQRVAKTPPQEPPNGLNGTSVSKIDAERRKVPLHGFAGA